MRIIVCAAIVAALSACGGTALPNAVLDEFDLASEDNLPALSVLRAGGLSGIAFGADRELLALSDARDSPGCSRCASTTTRSGSNRRA